MSLSFESCKGIEEKTTPVIQRTSPRTIPGTLSPSNKGAIDWGWQSFVAYGCFNHVVIIDTQNIKVFQTLEKHTGDIIKIKWAHENYYHDLNHPYTLKLASADSNGLIVVWDVKDGKPVSSFSETGKAASDMEWLYGRDSSQNLLVALHPPYSVILWNTETGTKLWKKSYTESLLSFAFDPFSENNVTFLAADCILFVDDFNVHKTPSSNGRKFYISNPSAASSNNSSDERTKGSSRNTITRRMWLLAKADSKASEEGVTLNECLSLTYHKSYRHHLLLLYPKEVLILDLEINQTVGIVSIEHSGSPMMQLFSCKQRDVFYILHESGSVSFRLRHKGRAMMALATPCSDTGVNSTDASLEVTYDLQCQSDALRLTKHAKVTGMAVCPFSEQKIALLVSDGRILFVDVVAQHKKEDLNCLPPYLSSAINLSQLCKTEKENTSEKSLFPSPSARHPASTLADNIIPALYNSEVPGVKPKRSARFKMFITGNLSALAAPPHVLRMCPPVTFRNWSMYRPLMAVGNSTGSIQVINMATGVIEKEYALHTSPVRGIEWIGLTSFISYSHPNTVNSLGHVRNELVLTDLQSGRTKSLRADRNEESPIDMIRVSYLRQYVIIAFKEEPFEIWDLRQLILLRVMPKNFPIVTALEWSPGHYKKTQSSLDLSTSDKTKEASTPTLECPSESDNTPKTITYTREHLVFTDTNGQLYHFSVEGNVVKNGSTIPADQAMGSVTCIAWKGEYIVLGDVDGNLNIWYLKGKLSKGISTNRGWIKKIRFGPGKGNMKILVLFNDGVDVWDVKDMTFIHQVRCPREMPKVQDVDWVGSDRPVLATADGCLRVTDIMLKICSSPIHDYQPTVFPFSPHVLSPKVSFYMKSYLHHLLAKQKFNTDIDQQDDTDMIWAEEQLQSLDEDLCNFLKFCPYGTAERCLHISRIFGDEEGTKFWSVALHFLKQAKYQLLESKSKSTEVSDNKNVQHEIQELFLDQPLDTGYDFFCDNSVYKRLQLDRVRLHLSKRTTYAQTQQCAERLLLLGQTDQAVQLLLETEAENNSFYEDCLRACLIATVQSSGTSQSIIKLVSTNLIASGRISEGVQLLCLIEKASDGCRYLQGAARWDESVWLAKATLPDKENQEILKRWVDYLCSALMDQKNKAILALLSMHEFWKAVKLLHSSQMIERAALFLQSCLEFGLLTKSSENGKDIDSIFMDYSRYLLSIKNRTSAIHYCSIVSDIGDDLRKQFQFISEDSK